MAAALCLVPARVADFGQPSPLRLRRYSLDHVGRAPWYTSAAPSRPRQLGGSPRPPHRCLRPAASGRLPLPGDCLFRATASSGRLPLPGDCLFRATASSGRLPLPGDCLFRATASSGRLPLPGDCLFRPTASSGRLPPGSASGRWPLGCRSWLPRQAAASGRCFGPLLRAAASGRCFGPLLRAAASGRCLLVAAPGRRLRLPAPGHSSRHRQEKQA